MMRRLVLLILSVGCLVTVPAVADQPASNGTVTLPYATFLDRLRGGWAGQMVGVSYGSVYEFTVQGKIDERPYREWKPEFVSNSLGQDDVYVEMTFLKTLARYGIDPTFEQMGADFRDSKYELWHANMAARTNLRAGIMPPESGHPRYNPHSDDIDFQIEADLFGLITPGLFRACDRLCDKFGRIMNYGDGVYGGQLIGAMYSQAYLEDGPSPGAIRHCVEAGLKAIPADSRYAMLIRDVLAAHREAPDDWRAAWHVIQKKYGEEDSCPEGEGKPFNIDAKLNGGYVVIGLLYGKGDLGKTMEISTRCGQDSDCNPASAAGVLGTLLGYEQIPDLYKSGIPALKGQKFSFTDYDFDGLVAACEQVTKLLVEREGGRIEGEGTDRKLVLPVEEPKPSKPLEQLGTFKREDLVRWRAEFDARRKAHDGSH